MVVDVNRELYIHVVRQIVTNAHIYPICLIVLLLLSFGIACPLIPAMATNPFWLSQGFVC